MGILRGVAKKHQGKMLNFADKRLNKATKKILLRKSNLCGICGLAIENMKDATIDHIIPLSKGGVHGVSNMQIAHDACNQRKGNK